MAAGSYVRAAREHARATDDVLRCAAAVLAAQGCLSGKAAAAIKTQLQIFAKVRVSIASPFLVALANELQLVGWILTVWLLSTTGRARVRESAASRAFVHGVDHTEDLSLTVCSSVGGTALEKLKIVRHWKLALSFVQRGGHRYVRERDDRSERPLSAEFPF